MSDSDIEVVDEPSAQSRRRGAKRNPYWVHFKEVDDTLDSNGRRDAQCCYCPQRVLKARPANLRQHVLHECRGVSQAVRNDVLAAAASASTGGDADFAGCSQPSRKSQKQQAKQSAGQGSKPQLSMKQFADTKPPTRAQAAQYDSKLCLWLVSTGVPFNAVEHPTFLHFVQSVKPSYIPAGAALLCAPCMLCLHSRTEEQSCQSNSQHCILFCRRFQAAHIGVAS